MNMGDGEMKGNRIGIPKSRWKLGLKMAFGECFVFIKEAGTQVDIDKLYELDQLHSLYGTEEGHVFMPHNIIKRPQVESWGISSRSGPGHH